MITENTSSSLKSDNAPLVRSPLFYVGDKYKLLSQLLQIFPSDIDRFIEPFTGGGSVALNVTAKEYLLNDIDANIVQIHTMLERSAAKRESFFRQVSGYVHSYGLSRSYVEDIVPDDLKVAWKKTYYAKFNDNGYKQLRNDYNTEAIKDPVKLYLLLIYGFNRMIRFNGSGDFNVPVGNVDFNKNVFQSLNTYFDWASSRRITWKNLDYSDFLSSIQFSEKDFVYLDPPYLITFSEYNKLWNIEKEQAMLRLLDTLNAKGVRFAVSNVTHYKGKINDTFLEWSKKYSAHVIRSNYISYHDNSIKDFKEVLVANF